MNRSARSVGNVLRRAGITTGYVYSQFGYRTSEGFAATEAGVEITRKRKVRYGPQEDRGHVLVVPVQPGRQEATPAFVDQVRQALMQGGLPLGRVSSLGIEVLDDE